MKKCLALSLVLIMLFSFSACMGKEIKEDILENEALEIKENEIPLSYFLMVNCDDIIEFDVIKNSVNEALFFEDEASYYAEIFLNLKIEETEEKISPSENYFDYILKSSDGRNIKLNLNGSLTIEGYEESFKFIDFEAISKFNEGLDFKEIKKLNIINS